MNVEIEATRTQTRAIVVVGTHAVYDLLLLIEFLKQKRYTKAADWLRRSFIEVSEFVPNDESSVSRDLANSELNIGRKTRRTTGGRRAVSSHSSLEKETSRVKRKHTELTNMPYKKPRSISPLNPPINPIFKFRCYPSTASKLEGSVGVEKRSKERSSKTKFKRKGVRSIDQYVQDGLIDMTIAKYHNVNR
jgi:hypothetical protein